MLVHFLIIYAIYHTITITFPLFHIRIKTYSLSTIEVLRA